MFDAEHAFDLPPGAGRARQVVERQHFLQGFQPVAGERQLVERQMRNDPPLPVAPVVEAVRRARLAQQADRAHAGTAFEEKVAGRQADRHHGRQFTVGTGQL
ncbi:hypothetical protein SDC9_197288 [bioreactor metagenome]|uniref:Uncharacterized protein n=1 Tax=bioreactor metagenome TaxID=1076179 RepID=A0A645IFE1_9ZZZZ